MKLKLKDPTSLFEIVLPFDPAIDKQKSNVEKYLETLDQKHLVYKKGQAPTVFHLLPASKWLLSNVVTPNVPQSQQFMEVFKYSVQKITNMKSFVLDPEVAELDAPVPVWTPENKTQPMSLNREILFMSDQEVNCFLLNVIHFVSTVVQANAFLVPGTDRPYQVLLSLRLH